MEKFIWLEEYSVEVEEFDFHHKRIFSLIGEVQELFEGNGDDTKREDLLKNLLQYGTYHLDREEALFREHKYPQEEEHKGLHAQYKETMTRFVEECRSGDCDLGEVIRFLEKWWVHHILEEDKQYVDFFHERGIY